MKNATDIWSAVEGYEPSAKRIILSTGRAGGKSYYLMKSARNCAINGGRVVVVVADSGRVHYARKQLRDLWPDEHDFPPLKGSGQTVAYPGGGLVTFVVAERNAILEVGKPDMICLDNVDDFPQPWECGYIDRVKWYRDTRNGPDKIEVEFDHPFLLGAA